MSGSEPGRREVAYRLFAAEFDDAEFSYSESDEERAPKYVVTPTGARVNRLFAVGVLTEIDDVNPEMVRGRIVDPTGAFVTYAGQYQPDSLAFLERMDPPAFLAITGKARTYEPEDGDQIYTSVRPETVSEVDAETRDRWVLTTAERTLERIGVVASAIESGLTDDPLRRALVDAGVDDRLADGVALALDYYETSPAYLRQLESLAIDAVRVVAGEQDEVGQLGVAPSEGTGDASDLATLELSEPAVPETAATETGDPSDEPGTDEAPPEGDAEAPAAPVEAEAADAEIDTDPTEETKVAPEVDADTDEEPASESPTTDTGDDSDTEPAESQTAAAETESDEEAFDPGEFELDEEKRQAVEEEYGTEFSTAADIEPADIEPETPSEAGETAAESATADAEPSVEDDAGETAAAESSDGEAAPADERSDSEPADVDLESTVMETMKRLDDGDGVEETALVESIADEHGADEDAIADAIQDALMSGKCYEPSDGTFKPI